MNALNLKEEYINFKPMEIKTKELLLEPQKHVTRFIAHRGFPTQYKQNTLKAFEFASQTPVYAIETDVRITLDGVFVAFHDRNTAKLSGRHKIVEKTTFASLQKLTIYDKNRRHKIPLLTEFINNCKACYKIAVIEIKSQLNNSQIDQLIALVKERDYLERTIFISFNKETLTYIRQCLPQQEIHFIIVKFKAADLAFAKEYQFGLDVYHRYLTKAIVDLCHQEKVKVNCWTVNKKKRVQLLESWGVDYITTDKPSLGIRHKRR